MRPVPRAKTRALMRRRRALALTLVLLTSMTPSLYAQSAVMASLSALELSREEQTNLAKYIRQCEREKEVSEARRVNLEECSKSLSRDTITENFIMWMSLIVTAGAVGYSIGVNNR